MAAFPRGSSFKLNKDPKTKKNRNRRLITGTKRKAKVKNEKFSFLKKHKGGKETIEDEILSKMRVVELNSKKLKKGLIFLGMVKDIVGQTFLVSSCNDISCVVTLKGTVNISVGDIVPCKVVSLEDNNRVEISVLPDEVNKNINWKSFPVGGQIFGRVQAREDHGYIIDIGSISKVGFIKFSDCTCDLSPGDLGYFFVMKKTQKTLSLSQLEKLLNLEVEYGNLNFLIPGLKVQAKRVCTVKDGVCATISKSFLASISNPHLEETDMDVFTATIVSINDTEKEITMTTIDHQNDDNFDLQAFLNMKGKRLEKAVVIGTTLSFGAHMIINDQFNAFMPEKRFDDSTKLNNINIGDEMTVRCYETNPFDRILLVSNESNILDSNILAPDEVFAGEILSTKIHKIGNFGIILSFGLGLQGLVSVSHVSDVLSNPFNNKQVGQTVRARVLSVMYNAEKNKFDFRLTMKKSLIRSKLPIIDGEDNIIPGMVTHGVLTKREDNRLFISFYNNFYGIVQETELRSFGVKDVKAVFHVGQTLRVRLKPSRLGNALDLSLKTHSVSREIKLGQVHSCTITAKETHAFKVRLEHTEKEIYATLPFDYLAEFPEKRDLLKETYMLSDFLNKVVVVDVAGRIVVSLKPSLVSFSEENKFSPLEIGSIHLAWITYVEEYRVLINFLALINESLCLQSTFVNREYIIEVPSDMKANLTHKLFSGQTVFAKLENFKEISKTPVFSLRASNLSADNYLQAKIIKLYVENHFSVCKRLGTYSTLKVGDILTCKVVRKSSNELLLHTDKDSNLKVIIKRKNIFAEVFKSLDVGDITTATIANFSDDFSTAYLVELSIVSKNSNEARVIYVSKYYVIVLLKQQLFLCWVSMNGLPMEGYINQGEICNLEQIRNIKPENSTWNTFNYGFLKKVSNKVFPLPYLISQDQPKGGIKLGTNVRFKINRINQDRGVVSVMLLNIRKPNKYRKKTFVGIQLSDLFLSSGKLPNNFRSPFEALSPGTTSEGILVDMYEVSNDFIKRKLLIKPYYIKQTLADEQSVVNVGDELLGIITNLSSEGVELELNRKAKGTVSFAELTDDLDILNSLEDCADSESKLQVLNLRLFEVRKVKILQNCYENSYEVKFINSSSD